ITDSFGTRTFVGASLRGRPPVSVAIRCARGAHGGTPLQSARTAPAVNCNGNDDDRADDDLLNIIGPPDLLAAVPQEGHNQRPNQRTKDTAFTAVQTAAANHNRGNDIELRTSGYSWVALSQARHLHYTRQAKQQSCQSVNPYFEPVRRDSAGAGGELV